jgi:hypothetical protein
VPLVIVPLVLIVAVTYGMTVSLARQQALNHLSINARLAAEIIEETLEETFRFARIIAAQPGFASAIVRRDQQGLTRSLQDALPFIPRVDLASVVTLQGEVLASYPLQPEAVGRDVSQEEPFLGVQLGQWHPYVSAIYLRRDPRLEKVVTLVFPVTDGTTVVGLLHLQHQVEEVKSWLQKIRVDQEGFLYVVDHHDQLVVYPFQVLPGEPKVVTDWPTVRLPLSAEGRTLSFVDQKRAKRWLAGIHPIGQTGWRVVAVQPDRAVLEVVWRVFWVLGVLVALLAVIALAISVQWAKLQAFSMRLLRQNAKLLKQLQQRRTLDEDRSGPGSHP